MKILLFVSSYGLGVCKEASELAFALQRTGLDLQLIASEGEQFPGVLDCLRNSGCDLRIFPELEPVWTSTGRRQAEFLADLLQADRTAIVHGWGLRHARIVHQARRLLPTDVRVSSVMVPAYLRFGTWYQSLADRASVRLLNGTSDILIAQCVAHADKLRDYGVPPEKLCLVYLGRDLNQFLAAAARPLPDTVAQRTKRTVSGHPIQDDTPTVGYVANYIPRKDHTTLFRALAALKQSGRDMACICVGQGQDGLARLARELGVGDRVCAVGPLDHALIPALARRIDVALSSSRGETFGHWMTEPLILAKPLVATRVGIATELATVGAARIIDVGDWQALAASIQWMLAHPDEAREVGLRGKEFVLEHYSVDHTAAHLAHLYKTLTEGRTARAQ